MQTSLFLRLLAFPAVLLFCLSGGRVQAEPRELLVAAASDLKYALDEVVVDFQKVHPGQIVKATYGSSGMLCSQIENGAPFDLYLSADVQFARRLVASGKAAKDTLFTYAVGHLVLWVARDSKIEVEKLGMEALRDSAIRHLAVANPEHAPYGRAAVAALISHGLYDGIKDRLVLGENVAQTAQFVSSGAADIGIIALSLAVAPKMQAEGRYWNIPLDKFPRLEQGGVIISNRANPEGARLLRARLMGPAGRAVLEKYGFLLPEEAR